MSDQYTVSMGAGDVDGLQAGVIHGGVTVFRGESDNPEEQFRIACRYLNSGSYGVAQEMIAEVVHRGHHDSEVLYHWMLATFAKHSIHDLTADMLDSLATAHKLAVDEDTAWRDHLQVVLDVIDWSLRRDTRAGETAIRLRETLAGLPIERREEIIRCLDGLIDDVFDDETEQDEAAFVRRHRHDNDRQARVPKFFMADPVPPKQVPSDPRPLPVGQLVGAVGWGALAVLFGGSALYTMSAAGPHVPLIVAVLMAAGGWVALRPLSDWNWFRSTRPTPFVPGLVPPMPFDDQVDPVFVEALRADVNRRFRQARPYINQYGPDPASYAHRIVGEMSKAYGSAGTDPASLDWLIRWHVAEFRDIHARQAARAAQVLASGVTARMVAGIGLMLAGLLAGLIMSGEPSLVAFGLCAWLGTRCWLPLRVRTGLLGADRRDCDRRFESQSEMYRRHVAFLADRPADQEMARWLDFDVRDFTTECLVRAELKPKDVVAKVVLIEPLPGSANARVQCGPPRFARYRMNLFLLTANGIRHFVESLNFVTGTFTAPKRMTFRYDMMVSVRVVEKRSRDLALDPALRGRDGFDGALDAEDGSRTTLVIKLAAGADIRVHVPDNDDNPLAGRSPAEAATLSATAKDVTGIATASRVLESVAAEGSEWLAIAQRRREHGLG